jgi:hypothetical protein
MFITFGKRGGGHMVVAIDHIVAVVDRSDGDGCELCYFTGNETIWTRIGNTAEDALSLIEFVQEQQQRRREEDNRASNR